MKYLSELLNKTFDSVEALETAEAAAQEKELAKTNEKKAMAKKVEETEQALEQAYADYDRAKDEVAKIVDEANAKIAEILNPAKQAIKDAQKERYDAIVDFSKKYGKYSVIYTGDRAFQEMQRMQNHLDNMLKHFWF